MNNSPSFKINQKLTLPDLAEKLDFQNQDFSIKEIFKGGMGTCLKIQSQDGSYFALKIIHVELLKPGKNVERYINEMKTWLTLSACNGVVEAICITRLNEIPCLASTWMDNGSIRSYLNNKDAAFFYRNMDRIISTLDWSFKNHSIIHRDLKPENILLDKNYNAFIADWGIAKPIAKLSVSEVGNQSSQEIFLNSVNLTEAGIFLGTILYASPEQIQGKKNIDHRSDIYSLGCIMYEWELGSPPFLGQSANEIALKHLQDKPKSLNGLFRRTNYKVDHIIDKCLEKNPDKRFQNYEELLDAFQKIASKQPRFKKFTVTDRYKVPVIGQDEFGKKIINKSLNAGYSKDGKYAVIELSDIEPYLKEGENLMAIGEVLKAKNIFEKFFIRKIFSEIPDSTITQYYCINYGLALLYTNETEKAISVLNILENAKNKPVQFYINLSLCYLHNNAYQKAEETCKKGLKEYPTESGLIGNLTICLANQNKLKEALESANKRVALSIDVNSLEELAFVFYKIAETKKNIELPIAIEYYHKAISKLQEAIELNPMFESAKLSLANIYFKINQYDQSSSLAVDVANSTSDKVTIETSLFYVARNFYWLSEDERCIKFCNKWLKDYPNAINLKRMRSKAIVEKYVIGNIKDGNRIIEKSSFEFFNNIVNDDKQRIPSDFIYLARILTWKGDVNNALAVLDNGLTIYPNYWEFHFTKSNIFLNNNNLNKALDEAYKAKKNAQWREAVYSLIASIYEQSGNKLQANKYHNEANQIKEKKIILYSSKV